MIYDDSTTNRNSAEYRAALDAVEAKWAKRIASEARSAWSEAIRDGEEGDGARDVARDAVFSALLDSSDWEPFAAVDISDIAADAVYDAEADYWREVAER